MNDKSDNSFAEIRKEIKEFPDGPGVYLMKDANGRVLYVGKAKSLRDRVRSYFLPSADIMQSRGPKIVEMLSQVKEVSYLECETEVDAILKEARLIKDIQPPYNTRQMDDKTFPYLEITSRDDFPAVYVTRQPGRGSKLYGPFTSAADLRRVVQILQRVFKFRTCHREIAANDEKLRFVRPCILYNINQCAGPCAGKISREVYRKIISRLRRFMESERTVLLRQLAKEMAQAAAELHYEEAARLRDEIRAIESLRDRGQVDEHVQPELFQVNPADAIERLRQLLVRALGEQVKHTPVRVIEGVDIAHIMGQDAVGALVCFTDGRPFKRGYRRFRIKHVSGIDDFAMIQEVLQRRYRRASVMARERKFKNARNEDIATNIANTPDVPDDAFGDDIYQSEDILPDVLLIDGGLGQLNAASKVLARLHCKLPVLMSLAKKEEIIFVLGADKPIRLARNDDALRLLQYVRDEAHRFAQHYFHILHNKRTMQ